MVGPPEVAAEEDVHIPPPEIGPLDPILDAPFARHPEVRAEVERLVDFWSSRSLFPTWLGRMTAYEALVDSALAARDMPRSLRYLPIIESGYSPRAVSRASAQGLWQLMAPTARAAGLRVGALLDERRDPVASTGTALAFLAELRERFDSWFLALAAYNGGPTRVARLLERHAPGAEPSDSLFWVLRPHLPRETREFVPRFLAAAEVAADPERYGLERPSPRGPLRWDEVEVPDATSLDVVARAAGVGEDEVVALNPQLVRKLTPRGVPTRVRLPEGAGRGFLEAWSRIPADERVTITEHVVARGETLWGIARQYGVRLGELEAANPRVRPERLRPGQRLLVPLVPGAGRRSGGDG